MSAIQAQVVITMGEATVQALVGSGAKLYGFKGVKCSDLAGRPLIWFREPHYSRTTTIRWTDTDEAFTSTDSLTTDSRVSVGFQTPMTAGQILQVDSTGGGTVVGGGAKAALSIQNTTATPFTCGLSQALAGETATPYCGLPLYGLHLDVMTPLAKVLLIFSTGSYDPGTVIEHMGTAAHKASSLASIGSGVLIDLTSDNQRAVEYDINKGWSWGGAAWAQSVPPTADLVTLLVEPESQALRLSRSYRCSR